jgi:hypothetical protein
MTDMMSTLTALILLIAMFLGQALSLPSPRPDRIPTRPAADIVKVTLPGYNSQVQPTTNDESYDEDPPGNPSWQFNQTCSQLTLGGHGKKGATTLEGTCRDQDGVWWDTSINLNKCFENDGGVLQYRDS